MDMEIRTMQTGSETGMRAVVFVAALTLCLGIIGAAGLYARSIRQSAEDAYVQTNSVVYRPADKNEI